MDVISTYFGGVRGLSCKYFIFDLSFFLVKIVDQMFMGPFSCPAKMHCIAKFGLKMANFQG